MSAAQPQEFVNSTADIHLITVLGTGSFGKVYLARYHPNGKILALKVVRKPDIPCHQTHLKNEIRICQFVSSPFICKMHICFENSEKVYFGLEFCSGGDLYSLIAFSGWFPEEKARFYLAEVVLGLEHLHGQGVLYRDLKPENVLLDSQGHVKLSDFGLSKFGLTKDSRTQTYCGTVGYMSPEIVKRDPYGFQCDLWSFGVMALTMLSGRSPFYGETEHFQKYMIRNSNPSMDFLTPACQVLIRGLLNKNPDHRFTIDQVKNSEFFSGVSWEVVLAKGYQPPFDPMVNGDQDVRNFERSDLPVFDTPVKKEPFEPYISSDPFTGFDFNGARVSETVANFEQGVGTSEPVTAEPVVVEEIEEQTKSKTEVKKKSKMSVCRRLAKHQ